ncbi:bifunctional 4-hydroxy-2-oxoglutarate aldolase/2-dehydro-3-deoxy-phosphogluconate aldolase [Mucilaginibacter sabulilitoris]|uniref:Bifunctional 4-hydroxy-2-oxoglutarate aldolase/2-dehydro-3-deoxy-phosphogluconate aldolase n=1 Tax=Mucilaginibacter sabulilitoris TaxID=1173583 RepID=A0ABZ0TII3_9SPHI|nr:bifunctional 4-hydroxy-2-oxoglutarate aldolase/2-dehydro-3-deoxy-phosphogluconate aldolase [Mucilaginibacter sabulilitoris]WPU92212.1 bifunctional 4-hydroxy-2-oxoglutarate aldolase/2-dehydro-3-deoxy-phosphogluconate aldolase [Mucilaginibacter sabulilitoris]
MKKNKQNLIAAIAHQGVLPLFYCHSVEVSAEIIRLIYKTGIRVVEYTNRGEAALDNFSILKKIQEVEMPDLFLGIGTVKSAQDAENFISAGADFLVAPIVNTDVADLAKQNDLLWIPGCMTPTEIFNAQSLGAQLVKLFPAGVLGTNFLSAVRELFPNMLFMATGGIDLERRNIRSWFRAGVCAIGMGNKLISKKILDEENYNELFNNLYKVINLVTLSR